jgi:hypothetical protein
MPNISVYLSVDEFRRLCVEADKQNKKPTKLARDLIGLGLKNLEAQKAESK